ncbi:MAG: hypothetical protein ACLUNZ_03870 [Evtepia sp.]
MAAFQLTPDSDTVAWMKSIAAYPHDKGGYMDIEPYTPTLSDMKGHWLTKQGWLDAAIYSGILIPADHTGGKYGPDLPVRRYTHGPASRSGPWALWGLRRRSPPQTWPSRTTRRFKTGSRVM